MKFDYCRRLFSALTLALIAGSCLINANVLIANPVQDDDKTAKEAVQETDLSFEDCINELEEKIQKARMEFFEKLDEFGDDEEAMMEFAQNNSPDFAEELEGIMEMVKKHASDPLAPKALEMIAQNVDGEASSQATKMLLEDYLGTPESLQALGSLAYDPSAENEALLKNAIATNKDPETVEALKFGYAKYLLGLEEMKGYLADEESRSFFEDDVIKYLESEREKSPSEEAEALLTNLVEDENTSERTVADAKKRLFSIQNLGIGKTAPEIVGKDTDGVEFKLSDYRGKVVMLDFWGDW